VLIPHANRSDLSEIPAEILKDLQVKPVKHVSEVFPNMLEYLPVVVNDEDLQQETQAEDDQVEVGVFDTQNVSNPPALGD
jgi:ATP-dependent Lon protease